MVMAHLDALPFQGPPSAWLKTDSSRLCNLTSPAGAVGPAFPSGNALKFSPGQRTSGVDRTEGLMLTKNSYGAKSYSNPQFPGGREAASFRGRSLALPIQSTNASSRATIDRGAASD
jgi:hypothetical protein